MKKDVEILKYGLGISWLTSWVLIIPISVIALVVTFFLLKRRKSKLAKYALLLSPFLILPIANISWGISDYMYGEAKLRAFGYPSLEFANINREYRVGYKSTGCNFTGIEFLTSFRYNQTVKLLIENFGYQKGSYTGILPDREKAKELIDSEDCETGYVEFENENTFRIMNKSVISQINLDNQHYLFGQTIRESTMNFRPDLKLLGGCLITRLNDKWIYIIERGRDRIIAQYRI